MTVGQNQTVLIYPRTPRRFCSGFQGGVPKLTICRPAVAVSFYISPRHLADQDPEVTAANGERDEVYESS